MAAVSIGLREENRIPKIGSERFNTDQDLINLLNLNPEDIETLIDFIGGRLAENQCSETLRNK